MLVWDGRGKGPDVPPPHGNLELNIAPGSITSPQPDSEREKLA